MCALFCLCLYSAYRTHLDTCLRELLGKGLAMVNEARAWMPGNINGKSLIRCCGWEWRCAILQNSRAGIARSEGPRKRGCSPSLGQGEQNLPVLISDLDS
ncbi:hypothetical protein FALCPG4_19073 [Fusarium falciforme]